MKLCVKLAAGIFFSTILFNPVPALAHKEDHSIIPVCTCWNDGSDIRCEAGWSHGHPMASARIDIIGYDEKVLLSVKADDKGRVHFARPEGEFYVLMTDKRNNGQTVEVDWRDIDATVVKRYQ